METPTPNRPRTIPSTVSLTHNACRLGVLMVFCDRWVDPLAPKKTGRRSGRGSGDLRLDPEPQRGSLGGGREPEPVEQRL